MKKKPTHAAKPVAKSAPKRVPKLDAPPAETVLVLRTCDKDGKSHGEFQWPMEVGAEVVAPDWDPEPRCGGGLHGLVDGNGDWSKLDWSLSANAMIVETDKSGIVELDGKVKFERAIVRKIGHLAELICEMVCDPQKIIDTVKTLLAKKGDPTQSASGDGSTQVASGDYSTQAASGNYSAQSASGYRSIQAASGHRSAQSASGHRSTQAASGENFTQAAIGDGSTQVASGNYSAQSASGHRSAQSASGHRSTQAASGDCSTQVASGNYSAQSASGHRSAQSASGDCSTQAAIGNYSAQSASGNYSAQAAIGNYSAQSASGDCSTQAASGVNSTQSASGEYSVSMIAGQGGSVKSGPNGAFGLAWSDGERPRIAVGYVGEDGIEADTWYRVEGGKLIAVDGKEVAE